MPKFPEPCVVCGKLSTLGSRCETHEAEYRRKRNLKNDTPQRRRAKAELYNYSYKQLAKEVKANATHCHLCGEPFKAGDIIEADHLVAGSNSGGLAGAHRLCNQRRGAKPLT